MRPFFKAIEIGIILSIADIKKQLLHGTVCSVLRAAVKTNLLEHAVHIFQLLDCQIVVYEFSWINHDLTAAPKKETGEGCVKINQISQLG